MKLVLGYILAFFTMTAFATVLCYGVLLFVIGAIMFITWSLPYGVSWLFALRLCVSLGVFAGLLFIFSKEGKAFAEVVRDGL